MCYHCTTFKATSDNNCVDMVRIYNAARFVSSILLVNSSYYSIYHPSLPFPSSHVRAMCCVTVCTLSVQVTLNTCMRETVTNGMHP